MIGSDQISVKVSMYGNESHSTIIAMSAKVTVGEARIMACM